MFFRYNIPAILWSAFILVLCLLPGDKMPEEPIVNADKIYHSGAFAVMGFLCAYGLKKQFKYNFLKTNAAIVSILISVILGGLIEILQFHFVRNRQGDWLDFLFDSLGAIAGVIILLLICRYRFNDSAAHNR